MNLKRIYLARRNPSLSHAAFREGWLKHHELGRGFRELLFHYPHATYQAAILPSEYDGVGMLWLRDTASLTLELEDKTVVPTMRADEARVFAAPVFGAGLVAEERILNPGEGAYTLIAFLRRRPEMTREEFDRELLAYAPVNGPETRCRVLGEPTLACDGMVELRLDTPDAVRFMTPHFARSNPIVVVTETILDWTAPE